MKHNFIKKVRSKLLQLVFPRNISCIICKAEVDTQTGGICENCNEKNAKKIVIRKDIENVKLLAAPYLYEEPFSTLVKDFKYSNNRFLASFFAHKIKEVIDQNECFSGTLLCAVPLHVKRKRQRGFSQTNELCDCLEQITGFKNVSNSIVRIKNTKSQTSLSQNERYENLVDAFKCVDKKSVLNRDIVLVDDVASTGTTLNQSAKALLAGGAKSVFALCFCSSDFES